MKKGLNPLFPQSNGNGLMGAYEYAALLDDEKTTYSTKKRVSTKKGSTMPTISLKRKYTISEKEYWQNFFKILSWYFGERKLNIAARRSGAITSAEYRENHKQLKKEQSKRLWQNWKANALSRRYLDDDREPSNHITIHRISIGESQKTTVWPNTTVDDLNLDRLEV